MVTECLQSDIHIHCKSTGFKQQSDNTNEKEAWKWRSLCRSGGTQEEGTVCLYALWIQSDQKALCFMAQFPWPKDALAAEVCCQEAWKHWRKCCCALGPETSAHSMSLTVDVCELCVCQWLFQRLCSLLSVAVLLFRVWIQRTTLDWWFPAWK